MPDLEIGESAVRSGVMGRGKATRPACTSLARCEKLRRIAGTRLGATNRLRHMRDRAPSFGRCVGKTDRQRVRGTIAIADG